MKAIAFTSSYWDCPGCQQRVFFRDVVMKFDEVVHVGPEEPLECSCGYSLSEKESLPARCGGRLYAGWWFVCVRCHRDSFHGRTLYGTDDLGNTTEQPLPVVACQWCKVENQIALPSDE